ncbi:MAG: class I SAM-dependent methyltransferase [Desulfamplus sp.]|nr:class I SAM-dependent methyltransferase [Desulfamplus sp.]
MLSNKVKKQYKHFSKRYAKQNIDIFRLYDWDIPEIGVVVDWYAGHLVVAEYLKKNSDPYWLTIMAEAVAKTLDVKIENLHIKQRHTGYKDGNRYERIAHTDKKIVMSERDFKFYINLDDYVDTGLFSDHRNTRAMVRQMAQGKDFLNLYCYTGSFSCYAAKGGAKRTVSVDRSESAIQWAKENMELNEIQVDSGFTAMEKINDKNDIDSKFEIDNKEIQKEEWSQKNIFIKAHAFDFLEKAKKKGQVFDIAVVDPPSFSSSREPNTRQFQNSSTSPNFEREDLDTTRRERDLKHHFDIAQDHPQLLKAVIEVMRKDSGSVIFFSTNHQNFQLKLDVVKFSLEEDCGNFIKEIKEITSITIPEDYKTPKKQIHRCWKIIV